MNILLLNRKKIDGRNSLEEVFQSLKNDLQISNSIEVPCSKANLISILKNLWFCFKLNADIVHVTGDIHYVVIAIRCKSILTIHDVKSVLQGNIFKKLFILIFWFWLPILFVKNISVISEQTMQELIKIAPFARNKILVINNPTNKSISHKTKLFNKECPIVLHIGTKQNKNLLRVIEALSSIPCHLKIVGKLNESQLEELNRSMINYSNEVNVKFSRINELYAECDIVSFPSLYEGFGLPILEANIAGRPILTSNFAPMTEIAINAACFVNPLDISDIRNGFKRIIGDDEFRQNIINIGFSNIEKYNPSIIAGQYNNLYNSLF